MAHLEVMGDFQGPGERRTALALAQALPDEWYVIAGRKLGGESRDDLDLVIVGEHTIFVLEEKSWGPRIELHDQYWKVRADERRNPLDRVNHLARVLAGRLRTRVPHYLDASRGAHLVVAGVVLSHEALELVYGDDYDDGDGVHALAGAPGWLRSRDTATGGDLARARLQVIAFLLGLQGREETIEQIGPYTVVQELAPIGDVRCFHARDGERTIMLRCYPLHGWPADVDPGEIIERERKALQRLDDLDRGWRVHASFVHEARQWMVVPLVPARGKSLVASVRLDDPPRSEGRLPQRVGVDVVRDAFTGLHEVHEEGLVHRGLHPRRIYLGRGLRVKFSDFYLARLSGALTIASNPAADADLGMPYRAPECRDSIAFSTRASDVFSLALALSVWLLGETPAVPVATEVRDRVVALPIVGPALARCLSQDPAQRPTAESAAADLADAAAKIDEALDAPPIAADPIDVQPGIHLGARYEILQRLGRGGSAETWLARDTNLGERRVIKCFLADVGADAKAEFAITDRIRHPRCARVYDAVWSPPPGYLVLEYVEGANLRDFFQSDRPTAEQCRTLALDVLEALGHLHDVGLIHRDVTPRNIIVTPGVRAKLIDFGLSSKPLANSVVGTPPFTAPEVTARRGVTPQSDMYGLAVTLIGLMLGRYPYAGDPIGGTDRRGELMPPTPDERQTWGSLGAGLLDVLFRAAQADPAQRPTTVADFVRQLRLLDNVQVPAGLDLVNEAVQALRLLYRGSEVGNVGNRGLDSDFAQTTYVPTLLDTTLLPTVLGGGIRLVLLTGNPGDGKTSFLVKVREDLLRRDGASAVADDEAGWRLHLDGHAFVAVYDASESHGGLSSDDLMHRALTPTPGEDPERRTVLLAINDGRLLQFFTDNRAVYPREYAEIRRQMGGEPARDDGVVLVDLKRRTLAPRPDGLSLARQILELFVAPARWSICDGCASRAVCPMLANARSLRDSGADAVDELLTISHLRRQRRATFRDVRSALAWLITGDRACQEIHEARARNMDLRRSDGTRSEDLAFCPDSADYLVQEWSNLDPGSALAPEVERAARADPNVASHPAAFSSADRVSVQRRLFFGLWTPPGAGRRSVRVYRYFDEFTAALAADPEQLQTRYLSRLLLGLSRMLGAPGYRGADLALTDQQVGGSWAIIKEIPAADFTLSVPLRTSPYVEISPDTLVLRHRSNISLLLTLDTAELVLRVADGELIGDDASGTIKQEIENFSSRLRRSPSSAVRIIDPAGRDTQARIDGGRIVLEVGR